jgi:hypothetical protein
MARFEEVSLVFQCLKSGFEASFDSNCQIINLCRLEKVEVSDKIDIRDTEYVWCEGVVKIKIESPNKETLLVVHYEGWNKYYDEIIKMSSNRIASHGTYTKRKDIPRYQLKDSNSMVGVIVNRA